MEIRLLIQDGIAPRLNMLDEALSKAPIQPPPEKLGEEIAKAIKKRYDSGQSRWKPLSAKWLKYKMKHGYDTRILHQHDTKPYEVKNYLANVVKNLNIDTSMITTTEGLHEYITDSLLEAFEDTPYVWFHEFGIGLPRRPFIIGGVSKGVANFARLVQNYYSFLRRITVGTLNTLDETWFVDIERDRGKWSVWGLLRLLLWFVPPSEYWKYIGIIFEVERTVEGELLKYQQAEAFMQAYIFSRLASQTTGMPIYPKAIRRRFRHSLYAGYRRGG